MIFSPDFAEYSRKCWEVATFSEFLKNCEKKTPEFWQNSTGILMCKSSNGAVGRRSNLSTLSRTRDGPPPLYSHHVPTSPACRCVSRFFFSPLPWQTWAAKSTPTDRGWYQHELCMQALWIQSKVCFFTCVRKFLRVLINSRRCREIPGKLYHNRSKTRPISSYFTSRKHRAQYKFRLKMRKIKFI